MHTQLQQMNIHQQPHHHQQQYNETRQLSNSPPAHAVHHILNPQIGAPAAAPPPSLSRPRSASSNNATGQRRVVGDYVVEGKIGAGSFATVWKGYHKVTGEPVAIKSISKEKIMVNKKHQDNLDMEIAIMSKLSHPNIVKLKHVKDTDRHKYLILQFCDGGDLSKFIRKYGAMSEGVAKGFLGQLACGLKFLREANLIHRDLKPQNLLLDSESPDAILKIADFGFARYMEPNNLAATLCGSPLYMAPEILGYKEYDASVDLWSVGGILFEMVTGKPPFTGSNHIQLLNRIQTTELKFPNNIELSDSCKNLLVHLLKRNPRERITFKQFFDHPFVVEAMQLAEVTVRKEKKLMEQEMQQSVNDAVHSPLNQQPQSSSTSPAVPSAATSSPNHGANAQSSNSPLTSARTESILKSLQTPPSGGTLSSTPPTPHGLSQQSAGQNNTIQRPFVQAGPGTSNLYGSTPPGQQFYMGPQQQQQQQQQSQGAYVSPQPPSSTAHIPTQRYSPVPISTIPNNSPPHSLYQNQQQQVYPKAAQQQVGFLTGQQGTQYHQQQQQQQPHQQQLFSPPSPANVPSPQQQQTTPRPSLRHNTPQYLRGSGTHSTGPTQPGAYGGQDGSSASIEREYVLIDTDANTHSQTQMGRENMQPSPAAAPLSTSAFLQRTDQERTRLQAGWKVASTIARTGDSKLVSLVHGGAAFGADSTMMGFFAGGSLGQEVHSLLIALVEDLKDLKPLLSDDSQPALHSGGGIGLATTQSTIAQSYASPASQLQGPQEQLAAVLNLYVKAVKQLQALSADVPPVLQDIQQHVSVAQARSSPPTPTNTNAHPPNGELEELLQVQQDWYQVSNAISDKLKAVWEKCLRVRKAIEDLDTLLHSAANDRATVRLAPPSSSSHSRRGSISASASGPSASTSGSEEKDAATDASMNNKIAPPSHPSRLGMLATQCAEKSLFDEAVSLAEVGVASEWAGEYSAAKTAYQNAMKLLSALASELHATEADKLRLAETSRKVEERIQEVEKKITQRAQQEHQQHHASQLEVH